MSRSGSDTDEQAGVDEQVNKAPTRARTARGLVLSWKQGLFYVPADSVISFPKTPYRMEDAAALGALLCSKNPEKWMGVCQPEHLCMLKGREGRCVYAVFSVAGEENESRFLRPIHGAVAAKNFPKVLEGVQACDPEDDRQRLRQNVLKWTPADLDGAQLDPKANGTPRSHSRQYHAR